MTKRQINMGVTEEGIGDSKAGEFLKDMDAFIAKMSTVKKGQYKASLRSKGTVNVNEVAGVFGGGGHVLASGCMFFGSFEEAYDKLRYAVLQRLPQ